MYSISEFQKKLNQVHCCDCIEGMKYIPDNSIDMILTDIPYNEVNRKSNGLRNLNKKDADILTFDLEQFLNEINRILKGSVYIFCGTEQVSLIRKKLVSLKFSTRLCVWKKTNPSPMNGQHIWLSGIETCIYGKKLKATFNEHCKNSVWEFPNGRNKIHPTEKPLKLFQYLISVSSNENDIILDPCMGSGTTAIACLKSNRKFIGFEISKEYTEICKKRIKETKEE